jgi:ribosomal protein S15P/S13E
MVGLRRSLLEYLRRTNLERYKGLIHTLGLRK